MSPDKNYAAGYISPFEEDKKRQFEYLRARVAALEAELAEAKDLLATTSINLAEVRQDLHDAAIELGKRAEAAEAEVERLKTELVKANEFANAKVAERNEAEAEVARLRVCGNCGHFDSFGSALYCSVECPDRIHAYDHQRWYGGSCQYKPSKWQNIDVCARKDDK